MMIPKYAADVISRLENAGFEAYAVGGCVRDSLMGQHPSDLDLTTSAKPEEICKVFSELKIIPTGIKHGTVTLLIEGNHLEITTFRIDGEYSDSRRPDTVKFTDQLSEDLCRRDFTVNAMAYNPKRRIVDLFGGVEDINNKIIRCVGVPEKRFSEDALRIMRALRFSAVFGFEIEHSTAKAVLSCREQLANIAAERLMSEFNKIITAPDPRMVICDYREVFSQIMPDIDFSGDIEKALNPLSNTTAELSLRLAVFFSSLCDVNAAIETMHRLKYDKKTTSEVRLLLAHTDAKIQADKIGIKRMIRKIGEENLSRVLDFRYAIAGNESKRNKISKAVELLFEITASGECCSLAKLAVRGSDIISAGIAESRGVGEVLEMLLDSVIEGKCKNESRELLRLAAKFKNL